MPSRAAQSCCKPPRARPICHTDWSARILRRRSLANELRMIEAATRPSARLKALLASRAAATLPGTPNALFARVIAAHGFEAVYVTGAGIANMSLGAPDIGLVTLSE